jgi:predicted ester cyclase
MSIEANKAIVRRVLEALDQQNFDSLKEHPGLYQTVVRQPIIRAAFPDLRTTIEHQVAEGDTVATRATLRGTHRGALFGVSNSRGETSRDSESLRWRQAVHFDTTPPAGALQFHGR